jgi:hypothetical protein
MLEILPSEEVWEILADFQCPACPPQLENHNSAERQPCHQALTTVTLLHPAREHNTLRPTEEKNTTCRRFNSVRQAVKEEEN